MGATAVPAVITAAERRLVRRLRALGAHSAATAQPLPELRLLESGRLEHLKDVGAVHEPTPGRYFVDDAAYETYRGDRRAVAMALIAAGLGAGLLVFLYAPRS